MEEDALQLVQCREDFSKTTGMFAESTAHTWGALPLSYAWKQSFILVEDVLDGPELHWSLESQVRWLHMIIKHRLRDKHQNADSLSKKTEFY